MVEEKHNNDSTTVLDLGNSAGLAPETQLEGVKEGCSACQIKISLRDSEPLIWRAVWVPVGFTLHQLHAVIQCIMEWQGARGHCFCREFDHGLLHLDEDRSARMESAMLVMEVMRRVKGCLVYAYHKDGCWLHDVKLVRLNKNLLSDEELPFCSGGAMAPPPESCGGIIGYQMLRKVLEQPENPLGDVFCYEKGVSFDPNHFNLHEVNLQLRVIFASEGLY